MKPPIQSFAIAWRLFRADFWLNKIAGMTLKPLALSAVVIFSFCAGTFAQVAEISTDRPDQSNTPLIIPKGALQVETGFLLEKDNGTSIQQTNYTYNNTLLKYGINEHFELRLNASYLGVHSSSDVDATDGLGPVAVGLKVKLADERGAWPQSAIIAHINLRAATKEFKPAFTSNDITLSFSHTITERWSLTYNGGVKWTGETPEAVAFYAVSLGYQVTGKLGMFAESYGFFPEEHKSDHRVDAGITYKLAPTVQCDLSGGLGLTNNSPDYFISTGLSFRLFN